MGDIDPLDIPNMDEEQSFEWMVDELKIPVTRHVVKWAVIDREVIPTRIGRKRHNHPFALGGYEVADVVVGEVIARFGHLDVVPRATDRPAAARRLTHQARVPIGQGLSPR